MLWSHKSRKDISPLEDIDRHFFFASPMFFWWSSSNKNQVHSKGNFIKSQSAENNVGPTCACPDSCQRILGIIFFRLCPKNNNNGWNHCNILSDNKPSAKCSDKHQPKLPKKKSNATRKVQIGIYLQFI